MKESANKFEVRLCVEQRTSNGDYHNLYIYIDGKKFELVPHCRTIKEKAYFYNQLKKSELWQGE